MSAAFGGSEPIAGAAIVKTSPGAAVVDELWATNIAAIAAASPRDSAVRERITPFLITILRCLVNRLQRDVVHASRPRVDVVLEDRWAVRGSSASAPAARRG